MFKRENAVDNRRNSWVEYRRGLQRSKELPERGGEARGNWHGHGTTLLRVPTRKILWQLVNKPQLLDGDGSRSGRGAEKPAKPKANFTQKFMQNYFVKFALRQRPLFWWSARSRCRCRSASWTGSCLSLLMMAHWRCRSSVRASCLVPHTSWSRAARRAVFSI